jgi:DNA polymerase-3 subunit delta
MPSTTTEELMARLAGKDNKAVPAILILGEDAYLRAACRDQIVEHSVDPAARDWGVRRFSAADDNLSEILGQARTVPMLAPRQVIIVGSLEAVEQLGENERKSAVEDLAEYLNDPAPFTVLVLEAAALDQRMMLGKLLAEKALVLSAELPEDPSERARLAATLTLRMAREMGAEIDADAAAELVDLCNANLAAIRSEIDKLVTYAGPGKRIGVVDVTALVVSEKKYSVWELADMLAARDRKSALTFLGNLLREGEPAPAMVGAMAWMYRKLLEAKELPPHVSGGQAAGKLGMRFNAAEIALRNARKIPRTQLVEGLRALYDADSSLKSGADDRVVMEFLVAGLIGSGPLPKAG